MLVRRRLRIAQHKEQVSIKLLNTKAHFKGERHGDQSIRHATSASSGGHSPTNNDCFIWLAYNDCSSNIARLVSPSLIVNWLD
jgi:hypothetical protein